MDSMNTNSPTAIAPSVWVWNSPIPYFYGGLALMLGLVCVALVILACSFRKGTSSNNPAAHNDDHEKPLNPSLKSLPLESRIVVVMAGEVKPSYIATPVPTSTSCSRSGGDDEQV